ncbi:Modular polyketide synthase [Chromobacterium vaccinii]|uniref:polyketide synthase n=1 Tax=Chromobacterium vaccinii TaxID=1108595 RepID=UPI000E155CB4|nr:polyketide synthase [Chromobacterium vaccinii]QND85140.1 Modular polyketide synthase [Chromobacterium vaccinii]QND90371.1 Modular polyketide synthase [Chromobacterium vaccinii]SUX55278.1 Putative polyketide biosynthesis enoyl-CoA isomerase pksI [Chromobacterium vaccinii]
MSGPVVAVESALPGVALIRMQDRANKNTFTFEMIDRLTEAFAEAGARQDVRAVVLTGYDSYFSSGGTQEGLRDLFEGRYRFTDKDLYSVALNCPLPVVAAMQGHGIGGGFVLGLFADMAVLARESVYTANFMKYGFTPGMGATLVLPEKLGPALAQEMMLGAGNYRGEELQRRGAPFPVLPREQVLPHALELAASLAEKPRQSLVALKRHLSASLRARLPAFIEQELELHEQTFHQPEVRERIEALFGR